MGLRRVSQQLIIVSAYITLSVRDCSEHVFVVSLSGMRWYFPSTPEEETETQHMGAYESGCSLCVGGHRYLRDSPSLSEPWIRAPEGRDSVFSVLCPWLLGCTWSIVGAQEVFIE